jgi:very-short-patch-repair endonuclease
MNPQDVTASALDRHERQRRGGRPAVSVLVGPVAVGVSQWRWWCRDSHRRPLIAKTAEPEPLLRQLAEAWLLEWNPVQAAKEFLAHQAGRSVAELRLSDRSTYELRFVFDAGRLGENGADRLCRRLLESQADGTTLSPETAIGWFTDVEGWPERLAAFLEAVETLSGQRGPAVLVVPETDLPHIDAAAAALAALVSRVATATTGVCIPRAVFDAYLGGTPESFAKAVLRESVLEVSGLSAAVIGKAIAERLGREVDELRPLMDRLAAHGATSELATRFADAVAERAVAERAVANSSAVVSSDRPRAWNGPETSSAPSSAAEPVSPTGARSAAETFLYEVLESAPDLAGLFELNFTADFAFGGKPAEIDLACPRLRIAVEIDGYYHFSDPDAYRRDRRKDWTLQRNGYLVLRFLAEDVVPQAETICETIRAAVRWRRESPSPSERPAHERATVRSAVPSAQRPG